MIYSILITILFILFFYLANKEFNFGFSFSKIISELRNSKTNWLEKKYILLLLAYTFFMLLPFFWGLSFFIQSDANVVVVVASLTWVYNWTRIIFLKEI